VESVTMPGVRRVTDLSTFDRSVKNGLGAVCNQPRRISVLPVTSRVVSATHGGPLVMGVDG
jgi:hypothetical protein